MKRQLTHILNFFSAGGWTSLIDPDHENDDKTVSARFHWCGDTMERKRGLHDPFVYLNEAARDPVHGLRTEYGVEAVSRKYDPQRIFQKLQNNGFPLFRKRPSPSPSCPHTNGNSIVTRSIV
ncbi:hypothetical protein P170DRAFT_47187 [Aspergillus steynii IBT 23096]|uniref:Uncharacterized protein n=1 Tax=Aspergillus steynii IBT 23096 TaxID=1392250 RepID=A0A2I2GS15_9EURO|nr:uncharacterized protein P170DRAFT_47187 [Aspergillus steynii IBT 23096]PLB55668.1 hypothetical protein P170DRAFT_47187 [Aspergillus steynii IBT 23096]